METGREDLSDNLAGMYQSHGRANDSIVLMHIRVCGKPRRVHVPTSCFRSTAVIAAKLDVRKPTDKRAR